MVVLTPSGRDLTLFSSFLQGIIQASLSYALAASVGFALFSIAQASLALLSLIAKIRISFVYPSYILRVSLVEDRVKFLVTKIQNF